MLRETGFSRDRSDARNCAVSGEGEQSRFVAVSVWAERSVSVLDASMIVLKGIIDDVSNSALLTPKRRPFGNSKTRLQHNIGFAHLGLCCEQNEAFGHQVVNDEPQRLERLVVDLLQRSAPGSDAVADSLCDERTVFLQFAHQRVANEHAVAESPGDLLAKRSPPALLRQTMP